jgi:hypothetical protein
MISLTDEDKKLLELFQDIENAEDSAFKRIMVNFLSIIARQNLVNEKVVEQRDEWIRKYYETEPWGSDVIKAENEDLQRIMAGENG